MSKKQNPAHKAGTTRGKRILPNGDQPRSTGPSLSSRAEAMSGPPKSKRERAEEFKRR